jgi:hypothetical protein
MELFTWEGVKMLYIVTENEIVDVTEARRIAKIAGTDGTFAIEVDYGDGSVFSINYSTADKRDDVFNKTIMLLNPGQSKR